MSVNYRDSDDTNGMAMGFRGRIMTVNFNELPPHTPNVFDEPRFFVFMTLLPNTKCVVKHLFFLSFLPFFFIRKFERFVSRYCWTLHHLYVKILKNS
jgi:hypothetical protein